MDIVKINSQTYEARLSGGVPDHGWGGRNVRSITLEKTYEEMLELFPEGKTQAWSEVKTIHEIVPKVDENGEQILDSEGNPVLETVTTEREIDMSKWCLCGPVTDNRDGTFTVKMGKRLASEVQADLDEAEAALKIIMEGE